MYLVFSIVVITLARDLSSTFGIAEVRSRHCPSFEDKALESHSLYVYFCPALFISCDRLYGREGILLVGISNTCLFSCTEAANIKNGTPQADVIFSEKKREF